ncbi:hypothetical protein RHGRI_007941 [Rhododendron griersonianum]|uniref:Uncharacterized protein n=1 Tax=Rhododendron griersonianum TaxID=479676 RepID=A0AAV6KYL3_9ERIC|nr:hypothetical protein RHGRI_007941 [Rhododendron griersonianum]
MRCLVVEKSDYMIVCSCTSEDMSCYSTRRGDSGGYSFHFGCSDGFADNVKRVCIRVDGAWQKEGLLGAFVWVAENLQAAERMQGSGKQVMLRANVAEATAFGSHSMVSCSRDNESYHSNGQFTSYLLSFCVRILNQIFG